MAAIPVQRRPWMLGIVAGAVLLAAGTLVLTGAADQDGTRELTLRARNMAFFVDGSDTPNPTLTFKPGERVRIVLVNEDHGFKHNLTIPGLDVHTAVVEVGEQDSVVLTMPAASGRHTYTCEPHAAMMRGNIVIE